MPHFERIHDDFLISFGWDILWIYWPALLMCGLVVWSHLRRQRAASALGRRLLRDAALPWSLPLLVWSEVTIIRWILAMGRVSSTHGPILVPRTFVFTPVWALVILLLVQGLASPILDPADRLGGVQGPSHFSARLFVLVALLGVLYLCYVFYWRWMLY